MGKEELVLGLFFNEPTKHWHFEEVLGAAGISRPQAARWLHKFIREGLVLRLKPRQKMPYYVSNYENPSYQSKKRLFALNELEKEGFLGHLAGLQKAHAVVLFGSFSRWDWHAESDIDVFIYGDTKGFEHERFRGKLHREIETVVCKDVAALRRLQPALLRNILEGYVVKGALDFVRVTHA